MTKLEGTTAAMKNSLKLAVLAAGMMFTSLAAQASNITFNYTTGGTNSAANALGNTRIFTGSDGTTTATATAWSMSSLLGGFGSSQLGRASVGLWNCNAAEGVNCPSPDHQIDNVNGWDFVLFQFSAAINPASISIATFNNADLDVTYFLGNAASNLSLSGVKLNQLAGLGFGGQLNNDVNTSATSRTVFLSSNTGVNSLLVGARIGGDTNADYFKISGMAVNQPSGVPEPSTFALTGAALLTLGLLRRRKNS